MIRWLSAWLRKPAKRRACELPSAEEHEAKNAMFRRSLAAMDAPAKPTASNAARPDDNYKSIYKELKEEQDRCHAWATDKYNAMIVGLEAQYAREAAEAARTLSRYGHAKARAKIRAKADEMNAAMGRAKVVWP